MDGNMQSWISSLLSTTSRAPRRADRRSPRRPSQFRLSRHGTALAERVPDAHPGPYRSADHLGWSRRSVSLYHGPGVPVKLHVHEEWSDVVARLVVRR